MIILQGINVPKTLADPQLPSGGAAGSGAGPKEFIGKLGVGPQAVALNSTPSMERRGFDFRVMQSSGKNRPVHSNLKSLTPANSLIAVLTFSGGEAEIEIDNIRAVLVAGGSTELGNEVGVNEAIR